MSFTEQETESLGRTDLIIEGNTATWDMKIDGDILGTYAGTFRFRCYLSPLQQIAADRERRELLGPQPFSAGEHESFLAYALTQLKHRIVTAPPFWSSQNPSSLGGNVADENIIAAVLDAALGSEMRYKTLLKQKKLNAVKRATDAVETLMNDTEAKDDNEDDEDEDSDQEDSE